MTNGLKKRSFTEEIKKAFQDKDCWECFQTRVGLVRKAIQIRSDDMF